MQKLFIILLIVIIIGCSSKKVIVDKGDYYIDKSLLSISQNDRIKFLIFHYTAVDDADSLQLLTQAQVSAHYLIPLIPKIKNNKPIIYNFVPENRRAWHTGVSNWGARVNLNDSSIGIEIVNKGFIKDILGSKIWYQFNEQQISAIIILAKDIIKRYNISPDNVLAHSDIAPLRKYDPGKFFPWENLYKNGIGAWPDEILVKKYLAGRSPYEPVNVLNIQKNLNRYGYNQIPQSGKFDEKTRKMISAFQLHFRPTEISGNPDAETEAIARALIEKYKK
ncbi:MAG: N-acetylmuramoyl-L-alanine amidase [Arsenophonus sp. ET-YP4-MAG3]